MVSSRRARSLRVVAAAATVAVLAACTAVPVAAPTSPAESTSTTAPGPRIVVATSALAESRLLGTTMARLLEVGGFDAVVDQRTDDRVVRTALEVGDADVAPGYTGRAWLEVLQRPDPPGDPRTSFARVREADLADGIVWLAPRFDLEAGVDGPPADATFGLFVRGVPSVDADVSSVAQLAQRLGEEPDAQVCVDQQFADRPDGWTALASAYAIADRTLTAADPGEAIGGVAVGQCLVGLASATDGRAWGAGLNLLSEPLDVFPAFVVTVQARAEVLQAEPAVRRALEPMVRELTTRLLGTANAAVVGGRSLDEVAEELAVELLVRAGREVPPPVPEATTSAG